MLAADGLVLVYGGASWGWSRVGLGLLSGGFKIGCSHPFLPPSAIFVAQAAFLAPLVEREAGPHQYREALLEGSHLTFNIEEAASVQIIYPFRGSFLHSWMS